MKLDDGRLVMERIARTQNLDFVPDHQVRARFQALVDERMEPEVPMNAMNCISWKKLMPAEGIPPFQGW